MSGPMVNFSYIMCYSFILTIGTLTDIWAKDYFQLARLCGIMVQTKWRTKYYKNGICTLKNLFGPKSKLLDTVTKTWSRKYIGTKYLKCLDVLSLDQLSLIACSYLVWQNNFKLLINIVLGRLTIYRSNKSKAASALYFMIISPF